MLATLLQHDPAHDGVGRGHVCGPVLYQVVSPSEFVDQQNETIAYCDK